MSYFLMDDNEDRKECWCEYSEEDINQAKNTSSLLVTVFFRRDNNGYRSYGTMETSVWLDNNISKTESRQYDNDGTFDSVLFQQKFTNIKHDDDGNKEIYITVSAISNTGYISRGDFNIILSTIPRKATITAASDFDDTGTPSFTYSNKAGVNVSLLEACISFDGENDDITWRTVPKLSSGYIFNLSAEERDALRLNCVDAKNRNVYFLLRTTIAGQKYIDAEQATFTVKESDDSKPSIASVSISPINDSLKPPLSALFIAGVSRANVTVEASAKYGAEISSITVYIEDKTYQGALVNSQLLTRASYNAPQSVIVTVSDSRGFEVTKEVNIMVMPYSSPYIRNIIGENGVKCYRSNTDGTSNSSSNKVRIKAVRVYSKLEFDGSQKNFCELRWRRKLASTGWDGIGWNTLIVGSDTESDIFDAQLDIEFPIDNAYTVEIGISDDIGDGASLFFDIPTAEVPFHLGEEGLSVGIGRYADEGDPRSCKISESWRLFLGDKTIQQFILDAMHPIGSFYITEGNINPAELFGGTWEQVKDKLLIGVGDKNPAGNISQNMKATSAALTVSYDETYAVYIWKRIS